MRFALPILLLAVVGAVSPAQGFWPFTTDEDSTNSPPRLHRLLEKANDLIELAEDKGLEGDADKALDYYRQALDELARVARENPERAETPEFAPLRSKIAATTAAIDAIRFEQVNANVRTVAVTDTSELERKYAEEQAKKRGVLPPKKKDASTPSPAPSPASGKAPAPSPASGRAAAPKTAPAPAKASAPPPPVATDFASRLQLAYEEVKAKDFAAADLLLSELQKEEPDDLDVLLLRAAAQTGTKSYLAARRTLEKAMRAHPKSYLPYYNLAHLSFRIEGEGAKSARQYYELGRSVGGPRDAQLERKIRGE